jgi:hypothetical protein
MNVILSVFSSRRQWIPSDETFWEGHIIYPDGRKVNVGFWSMHRSLEGFFEEFELVLGGCEIEKIAASLDNIEISIT